MNTKPVKQSVVLARLFGSTGEFCFPSSTVVDYLVTSVIFHFFPLFTLVARAQASSTKSRFSIEFANLNAGRTDTHILDRLRRINFHRDV